MSPDTKTPQPASPNQPLPPQASHLLRNVLLLVILLGVLAFVYARWEKNRQIVPSAWAAGHGWKAYPVKETSLGSSGYNKAIGREWRDLPFMLDTAEETDVNACARLAKTIHGKNEAGIVFDGDATRAALEDMLRLRPNFFYAEFLLGVWYRRNGQTDKADEWLDRAYEHAPVVLIQPYRTAEDAPLTDAAIQSFAIECNRVKEGSLNPNLQLYYPGLTTDGEGCIYLPAYKTVFRTDAMAFIEGYQVDYPKLGYFESRGKVGVLPTAVVRPRK